MQVLLIDDHPLVNYGLASCLEETGRFIVTDKANSLEEARNIITNQAPLPSIIILDILLGAENGLDFLPFLREFCLTVNVPMPPVLICSVLEDPFRIRSSLQLGAAGYVPKTGGKTELLNAIDTILGGETYIPDAHNIRLTASSGLYAQLTKRELEVLNLIKQNKPNRQIAEVLELSIRTVENHISNIYFKTGVKNREGLQEL